MKESGDRHRIFDSVHDNTMDHYFYIIAAYSVAAIIVGGLALHTLISWRKK